MSWNAINKLELPLLFAIRRCFSLISSILSSMELLKVFWTTVYGMLMCDIILGSRSAPCRKLSSMSPEFNTFISSDSRLAKLKKLCIIVIIVLSYKKPEWNLPVLLLKNRHLFNFWSRDYKNIQQNTRSRTSVSDDRFPRRVPCFVPPVPRPAACRAPRGDHRPTGPYVPWLFGAWCLVLAGSLVSLSLVLSEQFTGSTVSNLNLS